MLKPEDLMNELYVNPSRVHLTQLFGYTSFSSVYLYQFHTGIDFASTEWNAEIKSFTDGYVISETDNSLYGKGYGKYVTIASKDENGEDVCFRYGHFEKNFVSVGQTIRKGQAIGLQGSSGFSTGPHLHFGAYKGLIDPYSFKEDKTRFLNSFINPLELDKYFEVLTNDIMRLIDTYKVYLSKGLMINDCKDICMQQGLVSQGDLDRFANSPEKKGVLNEIYMALLKRPVDDAGYKSWKDEDIITIIREIVKSKEYQDLNK